MSKSPKTKAPTIDKKAAESSHSTVQTVTTSATVTGLALPPGRLMRRAEAAKQLQVSVSTLRRLDPQLQPVQDDRGVHLYDPVKLEEARTTIRQTVTTRSTDPLGLDGDLGADAFTIFDEGRTAVDAVRELRVHPDAIERLHTQWVRLKGRVIIERSVMDPLREVLLEVLPVRERTLTGEQMLEYVTALVDKCRAATEDLENLRRTAARARVSDE